jgi:hypothetical protein
MRFDEIPATMAQRLCQLRTGTRPGIPQTNSKAYTARRKIREEINLKRSVQTDTGEYKKRHISPDDQWEAKGAQIYTGGFNA